jgi:hypothetical protein
LVSGKASVIHRAIESGKDWRMYKIIGADQKQYGPVSAVEMRQWITEGRVNAQTLIQAEGQADWRPLSSFPEFAPVAQPLPSGVPITNVPSNNAQSLVNGPAIALMVVGILYALVAVVVMLGSILGWGLTAFTGGRNAGNMPPEVARIMQNMGGAVGVVVPIVQLVLAGFFIFASMKMRKLESYGLVMVATILSMLPCFSPHCCCILGLPIGIWILVVLSKPEVKSAFH